MHTLTLRSVASLLLAVVLLAGSPAFAQQAPPPAQATDPSAPVPPPVARAQQEEPYVPFLALTWSPLHLALPAVELTGEARVMPKLGVALVLGAGSVTVEDTVQKVKVSIYEVGGQLRYYVLGDFRHGMQLGGELLYLHASGATSSESAVAAGTAIGPFIGYKFTAAIGFTFDAQLGFEHVFLAGQSSSGATSSDSKNIPLLNLNVGWSF